MWQMVWLTESAKITRCLNKQVKGIVHPKVKILSSFTHPQVVPNLYECLCSAEHKGRYSEEYGKQSSSGAPLTSMVFFFSYYGSQWCPKTAWLQTFFKISSFVFGRTKKFIQVWNYLWVSKWWQNFHFWVNYPFNTYQIRDVSGFWLNPVWPIVCLPLFTLTKTQTLSIPDPWLYCLKPDWFNRTNSFTPCRLAGVAGWLCTSSEKQAALH